MVENREREREGVGVASHVTTEAFIFGFLENVSAKIGFPFFSDFPCHFPSFPIPLSKLTNQRFSPPSLRNAFASFQTWQQVAEVSRVGLVVVVEGGFPPVRTPGTSQSSHSTPTTLSTHVNHKRIHQSSSSTWSQTPTMWLLLLPPSAPYSSSGRARGG
ncbi:uncharacterized protein DS421_7g215720 [Arachis hypogaea]|nr:uncharacterized protein DS421_7g215720 [Arachis hypogaea]